jgi:hypothetical protein
VAALTLLGCGEPDTGAAGDVDAAERTGGSQATTSQGTDPGGDEGAEGQQQTTATTTTGELFPDVLDATANLDADGTWTFTATMSSPYDSPDRYADAWRVVDADGTVYGIRELTHDHASEQPFTRSQSGIEIPETVASVVVEGRDQVSGWGGETVTVELER